MSIIQGSLSSDLRPAVAEFDSGRLQLWRARHTQMLLMILGSYGIDTVLLFAFVAAAAVAPWVALAYGLSAAIINLIIYGAIRFAGAYWYQRNVIALLQMIVAVLHNLTFVVWARDAGALILQVLFTVYAFGMLSLRRGVFLSTCLGLAVLVGAAMTLSDALSFPMDTKIQRLLCGLWFASVLARCVFIGLFGARLRESLSQRNVALKASQGELAELALRDELTGALNRRSIMQLLKAEVSKVRQAGTSVGIALLDIDHFKRINDTYGHVIGDQVLRRFVAVVASELRGGDRLGRYGGEEFLLVVGPETTIEAMTRTAERVRQRVADADWSTVSSDLKVTVSLGVAVARAEESVEVLIERADSALYRAKREGRDCVRCEPR